MAQLLHALLDEGRVGGRQALPSTVVPQMLTPRTTRLTVGGEYGFGLEVDDYHGVKRFGHGGAMTGYTAQIAIVPDRKLGVVVLANGDGAPVWRIADGALDIVLDGKPSTAASTTTQTTSTPVSLPVALGVEHVPEAECRHRLQLRQDPRHLCVCRADATRDHVAIPSAPRLAKRGTVERIRAPTRE